MSTQVFNDARFLIDGHDLPLDGNEVSITPERATHDVTTFGRTQRIFQSGMFRGSWRYKGFQRLVVRSGEGNSHAHEVIRDAAALYLRLGEPSGTTASDSSGNGLNGTYVGSPTLGVTGALTNSANTGITLNGSSQYVTVPDNALLDPGDTFTLAGWFKPVAASGGYIIDKGANSYYVSHTNGVIEFGKSGVAAIVQSTVAMTAAAWNHVVITKSGGVVKIYINNREVTGTVTNQTIAANANALEIGRAFGAAGFFNGSLDEIALFATALPPDRVAAQYLAGYPSLDASLQGFHGQNVPILLQNKAGNGERCVFFQAMPNHYSGLSGAIGELAMFDIAGEICGGHPICIGTVLEDGTVEQVGSLTPAYVNIGTVSATQKLYAIVQVLSTTGPVSAAIASAADAGGTGGVSRIDFVQHRSAGGIFAIPVLGPITHSFWRVVVDAPGVTYKVAAAIAIF